LHFATSAPQSSNQNQNPRDWLPIEGYDVSMSLPFVVWGWNNKVKGYPIFRPLRFIVDSTSGELQGLKHTNPGANHVRTENRELLFDGSDHGWLGVVLQDGNWAETCDIITAKDLPDDSSYWPIDGGTLIRNNSLNDIYVLLKSCKSADSCCMTCFVKNKLNWSAPFILGSTKASPVISTSSLLKYSRTIAVDDYGRAFAAWVDAEGRFVGRWLTSHQGGNLQGERQN
jgi:hypothetical protein